MCLVYPMLPVSLDCHYLIAPSVFSNVYLSCVLCTLCCQFLWIVIIQIMTIQRNWQHRVHKTQEKQNKDTTQYVLDTTIQKQNEIA
jgi:hypothetical protein